MSAPGADSPAPADGAAAVPIASGLFTWPADAPQLIGSRCGDCGIVTFPTQRGCPRCGADTMSDELLARRGTLWAWTTQEFPLKSPPYTGPSGEDFRPFGVGYVELADQVKVEARLTEADPDKLEVGMEMELVVVPFGTNDDGDDTVTFAFAPVASGQSAEGQR